MTIYGKVAAGIRSHSQYLALAGQGLSPDEIKGEILAILRPHFLNPSVLADLPISILAHEAAALQKIQSEPWVLSIFAAILSAYREVFAQNQAECISAVEDWESTLARANSEYMSLYLMEVDRAGLGLDELRLEAIRNVGGLLEACLQPYLKAFLHVLRIRQGRKPRAEEIAGLSFGAAVEELYQALRLPDVVAPPPWGIRLNQWRNIAQHHSIVTDGNRYACLYRIGKTEHRVLLSRKDLISVQRTMQEILNAIRAARSVFIEDNSVAFTSCHVTEPRPEILFFWMALGIATQGFDIVGLDVSDRAAHIHVQDVTDQDPKLRRVHASQFLVPTWVHFQKPHVRVTYIDKSGRKRLEASAVGSDCEQVAEERIPFEALVGRVKFRILDQDKSLR